MANMYETKTKLAGLLHMVEEGVLTEEQIADTKEMLIEDAGDAADSYAYVIRRLEAWIDENTADIKHLQDRNKMYLANIEKLKGSLYEVVSMADNRKISTAKHTYSIARNGQRSLILKVQPNELPEAFRKVEYKADTKALRAAMGEADDCDWAYLEEAGEHLLIK